MDQQEWMGYVSRLANGEYPVPVGMIQDYNRARALLDGRYRKRNASFKHGCKCRAQYG